jgi:hypothetical protein
MSCRRAVVVAAVGDHVISVSFDVGQRRDGLTHLVIVFGVKIDRLMTVTMDAAVMDPATTDAAAVSATCYEWREAKWKKPLRPLACLLCDKIGRRQLHRTKSKKAHCTGLVAASCDCQGSLVLNIDPQFSCKSECKQQSSALSLWPVGFDPKAEP